MKQKQRIEKKIPKKHDCYTCENADSNEYGFYCMIFGNRFGLPCVNYEPIKKEGVKHDSDRVQI